MKEIWNRIKKLAVNRIFLIVVGSIIALYIIFFPHTSTTKAISQFTGDYTVQKERYVLHNMVEFSVENVCTPGTTVKATSTEYRLNGDIKSVSITNCDGTYGVTKYNSNGTRKSSVTTSFLGNTIQIVTVDYNKNGLLEESVAESNGVVTVVENTYYDNVDIKENKQTVTTFGQKTAESIKQYDEDGNMTSEVIKAWSNTGELLGEASEEYDDKGDISKIVYSDEELGFEATIDCDSSGCFVTSMNGEGYTLTYNDVSMQYELLIDGESNTRVLGVGAINEFNYGAVLEDADEDAKAVIDSLS